MCHESMNANRREKMKKMKKSKREKWKKEKLVDIILNNAQMSKSHSLHE